MEFEERKNIAIVTSYVSVYDLFWPWLLLFDVSWWFKTNMIQFMTQGMVKNSCFKAKFNPNDKVLKTWYT